MPFIRSSTGTASCLIPSCANRLARWQMQPIQKTSGFLCFTPLVSTEFAFPIDITVFTSKNQSSRSGGYLMWQVEHLCQWRWSQWFHHYTLACPAVLFWAPCHLQRPPPQQLTTCQCSYLLIHLLSMRRESLHNMTIDSVQDATKQLKKFKKKNNNCCFGLL